MMETFFWKCFSIATSFSCKVTVTGLRVARRQIRRPIYSSPAEKRVQDRCSSFQIIRYLTQASLVFVWSDLQILHHLHILYMERSGGQISKNTLYNIFRTENTFKLLIYLNWNRLHCLNIGKVIKVVFFNLLRAHIEFFFPLFHKIIALKAALHFT